MTRAVQGEELAGYVRQRFPDAGTEWEAESLWVPPSDLREVAQFLKEDPRLAFNFLNSVSAVDYVHYFELVYHLTSFEYNHSAVVKTRLYSTGGSNGVLRWWKCGQGRISRSGRFTI